jgi:hypothetical protein
MGRQLYIITDTRSDTSIPFFIYSGYIPNGVERTDEQGNIEVFNVTNSMYNYIGENLTSQELINQGDDHHSEEGDACEETCICGWSSHEVSNLTFKMMIKDHTTSTLKFENPPLKEFLDRMKYNKQHGITTTVELWSTDDDFNPIQLIKTLNPDGSE